MRDVLIYFVTGGFVTTVIVLLEENNFGLLSGFAALMPVFTLVAYFFIGQSQGGAAVAQNGKLVLLGTFAAWVPYMLAVIYFAPRLGPTKAIGVGLAVFFVLAAIYLVFIQQHGWFQ